MLGKNAGNCLYMCRMEDGMDLQCHRMQCKGLWQKVTEIMTGRRGLTNSSATYSTEQGFDE